MFNVQAIEAFNDNYIWCLVNNTTKHCVLVDPGDAKVCIEHINNNHLILDAILITHHHQDHTGGVAELIQTYKDVNIKVYGPKNDPVDDLTAVLVEGDNVDLFAQTLTFEVLDIPGHTLGHIAFYNEAQHILFCGDTLFSGGCGRIFEGTASQMHQSLHKLAQLPDNTKVYCAHEYTTANLDFALTVEPDNQSLTNYYQHVKHLRAQSKATIPTSIGLEKQINPFLRSQQNTIKYIAEQKSNKTLPTNEAVFAIIRQLKDNF